MNLQYIEADFGLGVGTSSRRCEAFIRALPVCDLNLL